METTYFFCNPVMWESESPCTMEAPKSPLLRLQGMRMRCQGHVWGLQAPVWYNALAPGPNRREKREKRKRRGGMRTEGEPQNVNSIRSSADSHNFIESLMILGFCFFFLNMAANWLIFPCSKWPPFPIAEDSKMTTISLQSICMWQLGCPS